MVRKGEERIVKVTLGELPNSSRSDIPPGPERRETPATRADPSNLGLSLAPAGDRSPGGQGVIVTEVDPNGVAAERGLEIGDVILDVASNAVKTPADVRKALSDARNEGRHIALMRVRSGEGTRFIAIPVG